LDKKYGQLGSADIEAQKGLARGLKNEIGKAVPEVLDLNAQESALFKTLDVAERRAFMDANKNPVGLSALTTSPAKFALFMADRSAGFKALMARAMNRAGEGLKIDQPSTGSRLRELLMQP
jgi:lipid II:glycine glycyltransferase (peptidoglycan interpeptide bridge formation enzyme)